MLSVDHLRLPGHAPLSFSVAEGQCLAIEGPSGSGKTRLLRAIADLDPIDGKVFLDGAERCEMPAPRWRQLVRYSAAEPGWWTDTPRPAFVNNEVQSRRLDHLLKSLDLSTEHLDRPIAQLSTGERLRLSLARAVIGEPRVLLLDEPTAALDPANTALAEELIRYQLVSGRVVLLVSHDGLQVERLAGNRLKLGEDGQATTTGDEEALNS